MKTICSAVIAIALSAVGTAAEKPKTVDEAVQVLKTKWLKPKDLDWILRNPKDQVVWALYRPFGTGVRNEFGLWGDNQALRDSCSDKDPEGCSVVIFNRLWESVRRDADPSLVRQLDCQFQVVQNIHIDETTFYKLTTGELVKAIQSQINDQLRQLASTGTTPCGRAPQGSEFFYAISVTRLASSVRITSATMQSLCPRRMDSKSFGATFITWTQCNR
jgi:hypothetical protein